MAGTFSSQSQLEELTHLNIEDFLTSLGLEKIRLGRRLLDAVCWYPAHRFARQIIAFDNDSGKRGLKEAAEEILRGYIHSLQVEGAENIPHSGPVLILANHPGMTDTLSLFASLPRPDLYVVAADRAFLRALPNIAEHLIFVPDDTSRRTKVVREVVKSLREGNTVLICPAGQIEPDPAVMPGALESLKDWSESISVFTRLVPQTQIVPVIVSGVIWKATLNNPLTHLRKRQKDRERMAAALQIMMQLMRPSLRPVDVKVTYGPALQVERDQGSIMPVVIEQVKLLIEKITTEAAMKRNVSSLMFTAEGGTSL